MSSFIVSRRHVRVLADAWYHRCWRSGSIDSPERLANALASINAAVVNREYHWTVKPYIFERHEFENEPRRNPSQARHSGRFRPVELLKAILCLDYQVCGGDEWGCSDARAALEELKTALITEIPGYDRADWGIEEVDTSPPRRSAAGEPPGTDNLSGGSK